MKSRARILGHPIHQILIVFPVGLLMMSFIFDLIYLYGHNAGWSEGAYAMVSAGIISGLVAAVFGFIDWLAIPSDTRAKGIGTIHGAGNLVVVALFATSWLLRRDQPSHVAPSIALYLAGLGAVLLLITGWLGGELVDRLGVGVDEGANLDAPNSLTEEMPENPRHVVR